MPDEPSPPPPLDDDDDNTPGNPPPEQPAESGSVVDDLKNAATGPPPPTGGIAVGQGKLNEKDDRTMGLLAHLLGGFTWFVGPLVIWLIKKEESPFVDDQGKEALNFQILITISYVVCMIGMAIPVIQCVFAIVIFAVPIVGLIFAILGGVEANKGVVYRYPFNLRLIS